MRERKEAGLTAEHERNAEGSGVDRDKGKIGGASQRFVT
jgi:hypothetical protein